MVRGESPLSWDCFRLFALDEDDDDEDEDDDEVLDSSESLLCVGPQMPDLLRPASTRAI